MWFFDALLWPGTKICEKLDISEESDEARLARSMFNTLVYLTIGLAIVWVVAV